MTTVPTLSRLPELIALAEEGSSEKRRALLRELTGHFFGATTRTASEDALYGSVLASLAADMETAVRAELSARFADAPDAPHTLIRRLANDEAAVASAVLATSPVLTDEDLLGVVLKHGQDHLRAVSARPSVSEAVSEVIVERGDDETLGTLLRNDGARLSRKSSEAAVERAKVNPALHEATVSRTGLPADLLNEMYFVVEARLRTRILEQNARMDPALLESALAVVCKAADLDRALFLTYAVVLLNDDGDAMSKAHAYARMYAELSKEAALRTLRFWRMRRGAAAA